MKVLKFGGTSVGTADRMKHVASLIQTKERKIVVLSAMAGTTNTLVNIANYYYHREWNMAKQAISLLKVQYTNEINRLYSHADSREKAEKAVGQCFDTLSDFHESHFTAFDEKIVLAQGELMSSAMMHFYLQEQGISSFLLPALDFMRTTGEGIPDSAYIEKKLIRLTDEHPDTQIFITQGFICRNAFGEIDNLQRGGSDYSASIIGAAIKADEIQIWTDIDGLHNNDPRVVPHTIPVRQLNFEEAAKLAHFGAKILHPTCIDPARQNNIPVRLLNTFMPEAPGTLISNYAEKGRIKAVAAKDNIIYIKIKSLHLLPNHEFLSRVFDAFARYKVAIDMVTTSEVGVSVTIDDDRYLPKVIKELEYYATIEINRDMVIVCVVGDLEWQNVGFESRIIEALKDIPVRMISYGGSNSNVSLVMRACDKAKALKALNERLFFHTETSLSH